MGAVTTKVSSFGVLNTNFYTFIKQLRKDNGNNLHICEVGCLDGLYTLGFLRAGYKVDAYEMNNVYMYGGHVELPIIKEDNNIILQRRTILGAEDRINIEELHENVNLYNENFFEKNNKQYDVVYLRRVLHRKEYQYLSMDKKIEALKNAVKEEGILYIEYLMWNDKNNSDKLDTNCYIKQCEMEKYFKNGWKILSLIEGRKCIVEKPHIGNPKFHKHMVGMIKVKKDKKNVPDYYKINFKF